MNAPNERSSTKRITKVGVKQTRKSFCQIGILDSELINFVAIVSKHFSNKTKAVQTVNVHRDIGSSYCLGEIVFENE